MADRPSDLLLGHMCVGAGLITRAQLDEAVAAVQASGNTTTIRDFIVSRGWVAAEKLDAATEASIVADTNPGRPGPAAAVKGVETPTGTISYTPVPTKATIGPPPTAATIGAPPTAPTSTCSPEKGKCRCNQPEKLPASVSRMASLASRVVSAATTGPMSSSPSAGADHGSDLATGSCRRAIHAGLHVHRREKIAHLLECHGSGGHGDGELLAAHQRIVEP